MTLQSFGWNSHWEQAAREVARAGGLAGDACTPGRVVAVHRGALDVETGDGLAWAEGLLRLPGGAAGAGVTVGDFVLLDAARRRVCALLPRRTQISRRAPGGPTEEQVLAANVDAAVLTMGLDGDFNLRRLERFLVAVEASGARPVVLLNKTDVCGDIAARVEATRRVARGAPVMATCALRDDVAGVLAPHLSRGEAAALLGSSGAGKSTILNALLGEARQETSAVREHDSRGRHTTTLRQLIACPQGWLFFDLPGLREVQLWAGKESLEAAFDEIAALAGQCRFRDCRHQGEPGCAVVDQVPRERLESYHRLERELEALEARQGGMAAHNTKRRWKEIHKSMKQHPKMQRYRE